MVKKGMKALWVIFSKKSVITPDVAKIINSVPSNAVLICQRLSHRNLVKFTKRTYYDYDKKAPGSVLTWEPIPSQTERIRRLLIADFGKEVEDITLDDLKRPREEF